MDIALKSPNVKYAIFAFIVGFTFLLYGNSIGNSYNIDDELVTRNHRLTSKGISAIPEIFSSPYYQDNMGYSYEYRPVVLTSFAIEHGLFGENPKVSHFINVLLYAITGIILFILLTNLFSGINVLFSFIVVLLFISHPLHTEVVSNIKNRDDILALLLSLISGYLLLKAYTLSKWWLLPVSVIFLVAGILSKMSIIPFVIILPLSLLMFKDVSQLKFFFISLLFVVIPYFFIPIENTFHKIIFTILSLLALVIFYYIKNYKIILNVFSNLRDKLFVALSSNQNINVRSEGWFNERPIIALPVYISDTLFALLFPSAFSIIFSVTFIFFPSELGVVSSALLTVCIISFAFIKTSKTKVLVFLFVLALLLSYLGLASYTHLFRVLIIFLSLYLVHNRTNLVKLISTLFSLSIIAVMYLIEIRELGNFPILLVFLSLVLFVKNQKYLILILLALFSVMLIASIANPFELLLFVFAVIAIFVLVLVLKGKLKFQSITFVSLVMLSISSLHNNNNAVGVLTYNKSTVEQKEERFENIEIKNIFESEGKSNRPIDFVEYPLSLNASWNEKIATSAFVLGEYLKIMFVPYPMGFYYGYAYIVPVDFRNIQVIFSLIVHLLLLVIALAVINKHPILSFGIFFYLISIAIFSNLIQPVAGMMADRFTYAGSVGFCIVAAYVILKAFKVDINREAVFHFMPSLIIVMIIVLCSYSYLTIARNAQWKNHLTLMRHDLKYLDKSAQAHYLLSYYLMQYSFNKDYSQQSRVMHKEAAFHFKKAVDIYPDFFNAWHDLGRTYMALNNIDSALICFIRVHEMDSSYSDVTLNIALIAEEKQDYNTAIKYYERLIGINPNIREGYDNLSYLYFRLQQPYKSIEVNKRAIAYNPNWKEPYENIQRVEEFLKQNNLPLE